MKNNTGPELLLREDVVLKNIQRMVARCEQRGLKLQPHFKTHQSHEIGEWIRSAGVQSITVSSLGMAEYFEKSGWKDILIAFPVNPLELQRINRLSEKVKLTVLTDQQEVIDLLELENLRVGVVLEIDTGSHRTGLDPADTASVRRMVQQIRDSENLLFSGFYSHAGHTYNCRSKEEIITEGTLAVERISSLYDLLREEEDIFYGDTPACSTLMDFGKVSVLTPGNFVFYDSMQEEIGSCMWGDIAVAISCPVVSVHQERKEIVVHGGAIHLSKDRLEGNVFGRVVRLNDAGWGEPLKDCYVRAVSQEHGIIRLSEAENGKWKPGDKIGILPVHSCLTAECIGGYRTLTGRYLDHYSQKKEAG